MFAKIGQRRDPKGIGFDFRKAESRGSGRQRVGEGAQAAGDKPPKKLPRGKGGAKNPPTGRATTQPLLPNRKQEDNK